jgi:hypothetical protein
LLTALLLALPAVAHAQSAKASAEALFEEGRRLMSEGKLEEACPKFADSHKLDASSGTLINLGSCYEKLGRTASAWASYEEAGSLAASSGRADHVAVAERRAGALKPLLARAKVLVATPTDGLEIKRDGVTVTKGEWGLPIPIDAGAHTYVATAPGHQPWTLTVTVAKAAEGGRPVVVDVTVPALERSPEAAPALTIPEKSEAPDPGPKAPPPPTSTWHPQRTAALVAGGIGVVGLGIGAIFAVTAKSTYTTSLDSCPRDKNLCTPNGVSQRDDAIRQATFSTAFVGVGLAGATLGTVLWLTAPKAASTVAVQVAPAPGGLQLRGAW